MRTNGNELLMWVVKTNRRYEVMEMHLVERSEKTEVVFCAADVSEDERMGVDYYLEQRKDGFGVGTVCEECKVLAITSAMKRACEPEI